MSNSLDPDQAQHFVGTDQGPNCLQRLSAEDISTKELITSVFNPERAIGPFKRQLVQVQMSSEAEKVCYESYKVRKYATIYR